MKHFAATMLIIFLLSGLNLSGQQKERRILEEYIDQLEYPMPITEPLINEQISDGYICRDNTGQYYLTGVVNDVFQTHIGIKVWQSSDLKNWKPLGDLGMVWTLQRDGFDRQKKAVLPGTLPNEVIISPKIHFYKNTFWITYSFGPLASSHLLRSVSGRSVGPYQEVSTEAPYAKGLYATLFESADSALWFVWGKAEAQKIDEKSGEFIPGTHFRLNIPMDSFYEKFNLALVDGKTYFIFPQLNVPGIGKSNMAKLNIREFPTARMDAFYMLASSIKGTFSLPKLFLPHGGCAQIFNDFGNKPRAIIFAPGDFSSPYRGHPASILLTPHETLWLKPKLAFGLYPDSTTKILYVSKEGNNSTGSSWQNAFTSIQKAIDLAGENSQIWISQGSYEAPVKINLKNGLYLFGGFRGDETKLEQRDFKKNQVVINGRRSVPHVIFISSGNYIRLDGLTFRGGNASGSSYNNRYGGGLNLLGGGKTVRIANCTFEDNSADQDGGAIYASLGASPLLINCIIRNNVAKNNGGALAVYANSYHGYHPRLYNCLIQNNIAGMNGGAIYFDTDQMNAGLLQLTNCIVTKNKTSGLYGNIALDRNASLEMDHCTVCLNSGSGNGAVVCRLGRVPSVNRIVNSIFYQNDGGHLFNIESDFALDNRKETIWFKMVNCIFSSNSTNSLVYRNGDQKRWKTLVEINESPMGLQNLEVNPGFIDEFQGNFQLLPNSPARNNGSNIGTFLYNFEGEKRFAHDNNSFINIGAY